MFKKVLGILLTLGLLIPALPANAELAGYREVHTNVPVSAEPVGYTTVLTNNLNTNNTSLITEEKALESFCNAFANQTKGLDLECEYQDWQRNGHPSWRIRIKGYDSGMVYRNNRQQVYVGGSVDGITGEPLELTYRPSIEYYRDRKLSLNREQALPIAAEVLKKMHADKISQLKLDDLQTKSYLFNNFQNGYSFTWKRVSEGLPVDWDSITIGIDAYSGIITQYNYTWHDMELPKANSIIDTKKVMDQLLQEQGLYLSYRRNPDNASSGLELTPVYSLNTTAYYADAISGTLLDTRGNPVVGEKIRLFKQNFYPANAGLSVKETAVTTKISIKEAMDKAQQFFSEIGYNGEIRQSGSGGGSGFGYRDEYWYFSPKVTTNSELEDISVAIDAFTGKMKGFHSNNRYLPAAPGEKISSDKALDIALACIKKYHPEKAESVVLNSNVEVYGNNEQYSFHFARLVNGLPILTDNITVEVDKFTGKVLSYRVGWYPVQHGPLNSLITEEEAIQLFKDKLPLELVWFQQRNEDYDVVGQPILAYRLPTYQSLNAMTGEIIQSGYEFKAATANNIAPAIALLYENGLITDEALRHQEQAVNRHQALIAMMAAGNKGYYSSDLDKIQLHLEDVEANTQDIRLYKQAIASKIIPNQGKFNPLATISREELAIWSIKALGLDEVGQMKNLIAVPVNDAEKISLGKQNYIGLAYGLGLIKPDENGNINPQQAVTWNDLATCVTRLAIMPISN